MSTGQQNHNEKFDLSFEGIDDHINQFDLLDLAGESVLPQQTLAERGRQLAATYAVARPILVALIAIALVPETWRTALSIFVGTLDGVTASFKAGKDLAVGDGASTVEMEPKLPTD